VLAHREEIQAEESVTLLDGSIRDLLIQKFPLIDARGHCWGLGVIATDITEHKLIERDHLQRQKLESLGLLSGGIAHDFNNLLGAMVGNVELFRSELDPNGQEVTRLKTLEDLIGRASILVAQILAYAGKGKFKVQPLDLNLQVEDMIRLLQSSLFRKASIQWQPTPDLPTMDGDLAQIQQVIMNLIINASEAVAAQEGVITIRTGSEAIGGTDAENQPPGMALKPGIYLTFEVSDNGPGMPPEVQERIFDPFFTTKFTGRGLGLSVVQGILRGHQGGIRVTSKVGEGTSFKLFFPAAPASAKAEPMAPPAPGIQGTEFKGTGTILVVDDEDALRSVAVNALRRLGFDPLEARDGLEALQVFEANQDRIRLVLMDLTMPRMDGEEAYREFRRAGSMVPIILSSGFGQEDVFQRFRGRGLAGFLPKPYHLQDLVSTIRAALEGRGGKTMPPGDPSGEQVVWASEFETGHPLIDGQHQEIVKAFNHLVASSRRGDGPKDLDQAFTQLMDATIAHFGIEEGLMAEADYPNGREHQAVHALLLRQISEVAQKVRIGAATLAPPVTNFLEDWLLCHLQYEDMHLARYLKTGGH
jgi:hemerythrin-like metal-binding protein